MPNLDRLPQLAAQKARRRFQPRGHKGRIAIRIEEAETHTRHAKISRQVYGSQRHALEPRIFGFEPQQLVQRSQYLGSQALVSRKLTWHGF
jgi:hypothetical protein